VAVQRERALAAAAERPSVAVLPFADLSAAQDQGFFSDGLAEEILNALAQLEGLKVPGRTSSFAFRDRTGDLKAIGRQLGVATVLEGSVRVDRGRVRVTAQLVRTTDGSHLWSQTFDRELKGVFSVQDEIATSVVEALRVRLLAGRAPTSREFRTKDPRVYSLYLQGRKLQRRDAGANWRESQEALEKALALDPAYAPAWALLASAIYYNHGNAGPTLQSIREGQARALAAAEKAVSLAPDLSDGYLARGKLRLFVGRDWTGALADLERAIALNPGDPDALWTSARYLLGPTGQLARALAQGQRASELDPLSYQPWSALSALYLADGKLALARSTAQRSLELEPRQESAAICLAMVELLEGKAGAALEAVKRTDERVYHLQFEAMARHTLGDRERSEAALRALIAEHHQDAPYQVASVYAWRGQVEEAFHCLDLAFEQHDGGLTDLRLDPPFKPLERDPRYAALLGRIGFPP
jgi:TolB-like protein/tetratricopeptide (TPR) repeat protein